jgi:Bax protein
MKKTVLFLGVLLLVFTSLYGDEVSKKYIKYLQSLPTKTKKYRFFKLVKPAVDKVYDKYEKLYLQVKNDIENNTTNKRQIALLMKKYNATDKIDLLKRLKPNPKSITLAQAAIESAWGTSRFFVEANNIFGIWSKNESHDRIKANKLHKSGKQVYLRKFKSLEDSINEYFRILATLPAYKEYRDVRYRTDDVYDILMYLNNYSEKKELYPMELAKIIYHNNLIKYDKKNNN